MNAGGLVGGLVDGLRYVTLPDPDRCSEMLVMYPTPLPENPWGVLSPIRSLTWGAQIPIVSGDAWSHALHGHLRPLREVLGVPPRIRAKRVSKRMCLEYTLKRCVMATKECQPSSEAMPECYVAPFEDRTLRSLVGAVAKAWAEDRYVIVVEGKEWVLK